MTPRRREGLRSASGFSLVEMLFVIGILALLVGILVPSLQNLRRQARRLRCAGNVREIARACRNYALDDKMHRGQTGGMLPACKPNADFYDPETGNAYAMQLLLNYQFLVGDVLVCPEAQRQLNHAVPKMEKAGGGNIKRMQLENNSFINDADQKTLSYGYISMIADSDEAKKVVKDTRISRLPANMIVVGDSNPRCELGKSKLENNEEENSPNHAGQGQNVGMLDESVEWIDSPTELGEDIYAVSKGGKSVERVTIEDV
ncbi:MAG: type II secretion system protein, partial [Phycisphaerae bacterium]